MAKIDKIYSWNINALDTYPSKEGIEDVIYTIHWTYKCVEGEFSASSIGTYSVSFDENNFIEYKDLKKSDVVGWLEANLDINSMKENLISQIAELKIPTSKTYSSPFAEE